MKSWGSSGDTIPNFSELGAVSPELRLQQLALRSSIRPVAPDHRSSTENRLFAGTARADLERYPVSDHRPPVDTRYSTTCARPLSRAQWSGVFPDEPLAFSWEPASINSLSTDVDVFLSAQTWRGVRPPSSKAFGSAPFCKNHFTALIVPRLAAPCRRVRLCSGRISLMSNP